MLGVPLYWRMAVLGRRPSRANVEQLARMVTAATHAARRD